MSVPIIFIIAGAIIISALGFVSYRDARKYIYQCRTCHSILEYYELKYSDRSGRRCPNCNSYNSFDKIKK